MEITKYTKKSIPIKAIQWNSSENIQKIKEWLGDKLISEESNVGTMGYWVATLEGDIMISWGDYIIQGIQGEFYPCKPDIFEASYDIHSDKTYRLIIWDVDWADEFNIFGLDVISEETYSKILDALSHDTEDIFTTDDEYYFGVNEFMNFSVDELIQIFKDSTVITEFELKILIQTGIISHSWCREVMYSGGINFTYQILDTINNYGGK